MRHRRRFRIVLLKGVCGETFVGTLSKEVAADEEGSGLVADERRLLVAFMEDGDAVSAGESKEPPCVWIDE